MVRAYEEAEMKIKSTSMFATFKVKFIDNLVRCFTNSLLNVCKTPVKDKRMVLPMSGGSDAI